MRSVIGRNVVMWRMTLLKSEKTEALPISLEEFQVQ